MPRPRSASRGRARRIASAALAPAAGAVGLSGTVGTLQQAFPPEITVAEALGIDEPLALLARVVAGEGDAEDFAAADWTLEPRIEAALAEVGLTEDGAALAAEVFAR